MGKNRQQKNAELTEQSIKTFNEAGITGTGIDILRCYLPCRSFRKKFNAQSSNEGRCARTGETCYVGSTVCERRR